MKRKAVSVTVVTITKYTIIALFVLWELFGVVFGLHPELGSLPYLGELNTYYKEENGIPTIIFWINILWATILAGICTMLCLIIRTYIVRVLRIETVKISWEKIYAIAATIVIIIVGIAIIGANNPETCNQKILPGTWKWKFRDVFGAGSGKISAVRKRK